MNSVTLIAYIIALCSVFHVNNAEVTPRKQALKSYANCKAGMTKNLLSIRFVGNDNKYGCDDSTYYLHGYWPSSENVVNKAGDTLCSYCTSTYEYDDAKFVSEGLDEDALKKAMKACGGEPDLWFHEWDKHGSCAYTPDGEKKEQTVVQYLERGLKLFNTYKDKCGAQVDIKKDQSCTLCFSLKDEYEGVYTRGGDKTTYSCVLSDSEL